MVTIQCPKCKKEFSHKNQKNANQALMMHTMRKHRRKKRRLQTTPTVEKSPQQEKQEPALPKFRFCPQCGLNLHILTVSFGIAGRASHV